MSYDWNHVFVDGDDLFELGWINKINHAFRERFADPTSKWVNISAGHDVQSYSFWTNLQIDLSAPPPSARLLSGNWAKPDTDLEGVDSTGSAYGDTALTSAYIKTTALGGNDYTRKYPREITDLGATTYIDGSAFANGHNARNRNDTRVYLRSAGTWVIQALGTDPDIITTYGRMSAGDYIGPWVLNEIRDVLNLFVAIWGDTASFTADGTDNFYSIDSHSESTWAAAEATAASYYAIPEISISSDIPPFVVAFGVAGEASGSTLYTEIFQRVRAKCAIGDDSDGYTPSIDVYIPGATEVSGDWVDDTGSPTYDDNGDQVLHDKYHKFATLTGIGTGGTLLTGWLGSLAQPNDCPQPVISSPPSGGERQQRFQGYFVNGPNPLPLFFYNVAGGFTERP